MLKDKRIRIIIGHYGSGKTEFAVNYGIKLAEAGKKVSLVDLDVVNPYFRSREKEAFLREKGIKLIASSLNKSIGIDLPAISAGILAPLQDESYDVVLDVGGDAVGARVLAVYKGYIEEGSYDMFCVLNANRPETETVDGAIRHIKSIESTSKLKVTGLVNNTHLLRETSVEDVLKGQKLALEVSKELDIPIKYISVLEEVAKELPRDMEGEIIPIHMHMREEWM